MDSEPLILQESGLLTLSDASWPMAQQRLAVIAPLANQPDIGHMAADEAAQLLGVSRRQVYILIRRYRQGKGVLTDMAPGQSSGGKGKGRLSAAVEAIIQEQIRKLYLNRQKRSVAALHRAISRACKVKGLPVPARNSVSLRINHLDPLKTARRRGGPDEARRLESAGDDIPPITSLLEQVQIDHTDIDLVVVDEKERLPIGRPYLTIGIDVLTRCVVGLVVTLDPPSAVSAGLCLAHAACDKRPWLERLHIEAEWPMSGKPYSLYLDNASEFHSEALERGCDQHKIKLDYRPVGSPHYGGIVERIIGTAMQMIHELPGTTFSNPAERGSYDSDKKAILTLKELEHWLSLAILVYHGTVHGSLLQPPAALWAQAVAREGRPAMVTQPEAFLVDFLPVLRRTLTRTGFMIDHIQYFSNALKPWIARREALPSFLIRRDPRDISRIFVLEPEEKHYLVVPYRNISHPAITLWEHRQAIARLREQGRAQVDEELLFRMIAQMHDITQNAVRTTRKTRRENERRQHLLKEVPTTNAAPPVTDPSVEDEPLAEPFKQIEEW